MTDEPNRDSVIDTQISIAGRPYLRLIIKYVSGTKEVADYAVVVIDGDGNSMGLKIVGWRRGCPVIGLVTYATWLVIASYDHARKETAASGGDIQPLDDSDTLFGGRTPDHVDYLDAWQASYTMELEEGVREQILASLEPVTV